MVSPFSDPVNEVLPDREHLSPKKGQLIQRPLLSSAALSQRSAVQAILSLKIYVKAVLFLTGRHLALSCFSSGALLPDSMSPAQAVKQRGVKRVHSLHPPTLHHCKIKLPHFCTRKEYHWRFLAYFDFFLNIHNFLFPFPPGHATLCMRCICAWLRLCLPPGSWRSLRAFSLFLKADSVQLISNVKECIHLNQLDCL